MEASTAKAYLRCRAWGGKCYASRENLCFLYTEAFSEKNSRLIHASIAGECFIKHIMLIM